MLYLEKASPVLCENIEAVEVKRVLGDGWALGDGRAPLLHEAQQLVEPGPSLGVVVDLVEPLQVLHLGLLKQQQHND